MLVHKPASTRVSERKRTTFQQELDEKLQHRRSKGFGTGFSSDDDDDNAGGDDNYSDESFDADDDDDLLKQFTTNKKKKDNYNNKFDLSDDDDDDDFASSSVFMKTMKQGDNEDDKFTKLLQETINPTGRKSPKDVPIGRKSPDINDLLGRKSPKMTDHHSGRKSPEALGKRSPTLDDLLGRKSPKITDHHSSRKSPTLDELLGRKSPKTIDATGRKSPAYTEGRKSPKYTDSVGRKSPNIVEGKAAEAERSKSPNFSNLLSGGRWSEHEPPVVAPKPRSRRNNILRETTSFDRGDDIGSSMTSQSPLLDFMKREEGVPVPKRRSKQTSEDLIESLLNNKTPSDEQELSHHQRRHSNRSSVSSNKVMTSHQQHDELGRKSPKDVPIRRKSPDMNDLLGRKSPKITDHHSSRKSPILDELLGRKSPKTIDATGRKSPAYTEGRKSPKYTDSVGRKSPKSGKMLSREPTESELPHRRRRGSSPKPQQLAMDDVMKMFSGDDKTATRNDGDVTAEAGIKFEQRQQQQPLARTTQNIRNESAIAHVAMSNKGNSPDAEVEEELGLTMKKTRAKSAGSKRFNKPPRGYQGLGSLSAHKQLRTMTPTASMEATSSGDIRQTIYLEWLAKREKDRKLKKVEEKRALKEAEEKKEREAREKKEENELARKAWLESKGEMLKKKERMKREEERERRKMILEQEEEKWKSSKKCDVMRRQALEEAKTKHRRAEEARKREEELKRRDEMKRKKENQKAVEKWNKTRGSKWSREQKMKRREVEEEKEKKRAEERKKERQALKKYEEWYEEKSVEPIRRKPTTLLDEERPVWSPASKLVHSR